MTMPEVMYLRSIMEYNPETGKLYWKHRADKDDVWNEKHANREALCAVIGVGYLGGYVDGVRQSAHRVAWCIHYGFEPPEFIDHINSDKKDNRISNLRLATKSQNEMNKPKKQGTSSIYKGVTWSKARGKWLAQINTNGKYKYLGYHVSEDAAKEAYERAAIELHGEYRYHTATEGK